MRQRDSSSSSCSHVTGREKRGCRRAVDGTNLLLLLGLDINIDKTVVDLYNTTNTPHPTTSMKVTINSFRAVATWKWDLPEESDDTCGICRVNFEGTCSKCKFPGDDCPIIVGECRHCFHMVCRLVIVADLVSRVETDSFLALHQRLDFFRC
jgi:anaphase-promoting complex subunit 11